MFYTVSSYQYLEIFWELFGNSKYFFEKLAIFRVRDLELFCDQYSSIVPAFNCLRVATTQWNYLCLLIHRNAFGFILKFQTVFEKHAIFCVWTYMVIRMAKEYLSTFKSLKAKEKARLSSPMAPAVRHTFRGLIITKTNSHENY